VVGVTAAVVIPLVLINSASGVPTNGPLGDGNVYLSVCGPAKPGVAGGGSYLLRTHNSYRLADSC
jgi:hypothetical protein